MQFVELVRGRIEGERYAIARVMQDRVHLRVENEPGYCGWTFVVGIGSKMLSVFVRW